MNRWRWLKWQKFVVLAIASLLTIFILGTTILAQPKLSDDFPLPEIHSLPESLAKWQDKSDSGDYFNLVNRTPLGYLVWSQFPVTIFLEQPASFSNSAADKRYREWVLAVKKAIAEWNVYLPLQEIAQREEADIVVLRSQPARKAKFNPDTQLYDLPRAVTAETSYKFYLRSNPAILAHKMKIEVSPNYAGIALLATIRHELGHALGIWGHSKNESDALYFSQVSDPCAISSRDINTLKKIYQQPTRLGWKLRSQ